MSKREHRLRHGELLTEAWNPSIKTDAYAVLTIDGEPVPLKSLRVPESIANQVVPQGAARARFFTLGEARIIVSVDNTAAHGRMLHVSVSKHDQLPSWAEMIAVKRHFFPDDVAGVMVMPEEEVYVNAHEFTLHIWQLPVKWSIG